jgi:predicted HAD superfamily Cof-like phosphohydrolase
MDYLRMVEEFHRSFELHGPSRPTIPVARDMDYIGVEKEALRDTAYALGQFSQNLLDLANASGSVAFMRLHLIIEETAELAEAMHDKSLVETMDALCDIQYVVSGAVLALGMHHHFDDAFQEVHRSNMDKLVDGKPVKSPGGRVIKPAGWTPPDIHAVLSKHHLFENGDDHVPDAIKDRNGSVVLGLCKACNAAEIELDQPCYLFKEGGE